MPGNKETIGSHQAIWSRFKRKRITTLYYNLNYSLVILFTTTITHFLIKTCYKANPKLL